MRSLVFIAFAALLMSVAPASAGHDGVQPLDRILSHLRSQRGGTFYDADGPYPDGNGGMHYRIKWLTPEGRLIWLDTDARTGRVLGIDHNNFRDDDRGRHFDNDQDRRNDYDDQPREDFPRDPRWPRWQNGAPVGGGRWHDRDGGDWHDHDNGRGGDWQGGGGHDGGDRGGDHGGGHDSDHGGGDGRGHW